MEVIDIGNEGGATRAKRTSPLRVRPVASHKVELEEEAARERKATTDDDAVTLSEGQTRGIDMIQSDAAPNVMVLGPPGAGKTMMLRALVKKLRREQPTVPVVVLCTQNAFAQRLHVCPERIDAQTVHHFFHLTPNMLKMARMSDVWAKVKSRLQASDAAHPLLQSDRLVIVLEEGFTISQLLFKVMEYILRHRPHADGTKPAGGCQIILMGDPSQCKPIEGDYLFENNPFMLLFDTVLTLGAQHRVRDPRLARILDHIMSARTAQEARLPAPLLAEAQAALEATRKAVSPKDRLSIPIVACRHATVDAINEKRMEQLQLAEQPFATFDQVTGVVPTHEPILDEQLARMGAEHLRHVRKALTMTRIPRFALLRITVTVDKQIRNGRLVRVLSILPPSVPGTEAAARAGFEKEVERAVSANVRSFVSEYLPRVKVVFVDKQAGDASAFILPIVVTANVLPSYHLKTLTRLALGGRARGSAMPTQDALSHQLSVDHPAYPRAYTAHIGVKAGWAQTIHSMQGATQPRLVVQGLHEVWDGMGVMIVFRVPSLDGLVAPDFPNTAAAWHKVLAIHPCVRKFLTHLRDEVDPGIILVDRVKCGFGRREVLADGSVLLTHTPLSASVAAELFMLLQHKRHSHAHDCLTRTTDAQSKHCITPGVVAPTHQSLVNMGFNLPQGRGMQTRRCYSDSALSTLTSSSLSSSVPAIQVLPSGVRKRLRDAHDGDDGESGKAAEAAEAAEAASGDEPSPVRRRPKKKLRRRLHTLGSSVVPVSDTAST